jgi:hypothetical protein
MYEQKKQNSVIHVTVNKHTQSVVFNVLLTISGCGKTANFPHLETNPQPQQHILVTKSVFV